MGCGSIGFNAGNLTRVDSRMKVSLKGLPDKLRGVAWPSSARTVRRAVKSVKLVKLDHFFFNVQFDEDDRARPTLPFAIAL